MKSLEKYSDLLISECKRLEPCLAEVCGDDSTETKVIYENTDFSVASTSQSTILGLRVIVGNRLGFITTNTLDESDLKEKAKEAQMVARLSPSSPFHDIAAAAKKSDPFVMVDEKLENVSAKQILKWTELLVDESRKDPRISLDRAELSLHVSSRVIQNSNGIFQKMKQVVCSWYVMGMAKTETEVTSFDYDGNSTATFDDVEEKIRATAKEFRESVLGSLNATSAKSYRGPVLFHPSAVDALLVGVVQYNINARAQQDGMSKWGKNMGAQVASKLFSFAEDPLDKTRPGDWMPFDREGVPTMRHEIIKNGVLNFTAHNSFTAKRAKVGPTGNATGGSRSMPAIGVQGLTISAGTSSQDELYKTLKSGLVLKRFSGNSDPVSGEFSGIAKNSWWVENGKRHSSLKEVMISGNMFDLLNQIQMVGSQIFRQSGSFDSPYILIDGVSVTSA